MHKLFMPLVLAFSILLVGCETVGQPSSTPSLSELKYDKLTFSPPKVRKVVLNNGMTLHLFENHELPIVEIEGLVKIGSGWGSIDKRGVASLAGSLWRSGGTTNIKPSELDQKLEFIAASIETSIDADSGSIGMSVLKKDIDEGLKLFADIIKNPAFDKKRFKIAKSAMIEGLKRQNDDPKSIAKRELNKLLYKGHIYGVQATTKTVENISRKDAVDFYKNHVGPESFTLGITGDFNSDDMVKKFEKLFADFKPAKIKLGKIPPPHSSFKPAIYLIDKKRPQSVIRGGHYGVSRKNPDYYPVKVMNYILGGGGFSSRMMQKIRSDKGLAYSVWSYYTGGTWDEGLFLTGGETKTKSTAEFIKLSKKIMNEIIKNGVTEKELRQAKSSMVNSFVHAFEKDLKIVSQYVWLDYFDMPDDYLDRYRDRIDAVTMDDIRRVAVKYLRPNNMVYVVVGDIKKMGDEMNELGTIKEIKLD